MTTGMTLRITRPGFITPACSRGNEGGGWWIVVVVRQRAVRFWQGQRGRMDGWTVGTVVVVRQRAVRVSVWSIRHVVRPQQQEIHPGPTTPPPSLQNARGCKNTPRTHGADADARLGRSVGGAQVCGEWGCWSWVVSASCVCAMPCGIM